MQFEIIRELEEDDPKLEVPWADVEDPSLRYYDLKAHPERIGSLVEVRRYPILGEALRRLNAPGSRFRTVKCGVGETDELTQEEMMEVERADAGRAHKVGSYLDVLFEVPGFNYDVERYLQLGEKLEHRLEKIPLPVQVEFTLRRCLFHDEEKWGYYVTLYLHVYGETAEDAGKNWNRAMEELTHALGEISLTRRNSEEKQKSRLL